MKDSGKNVWYSIECKPLDARRWYSSIIDSKKYRLLKDVKKACDRVKRINPRSRYRIIKSTNTVKVIYVDKLKKLDKQSKVC
jgi:hypothetical protein